MLEIVDRWRLLYEWAKVFAPMIAWQMDGEPGFPFHLEDCAWLVNRRRGQQLELFG
jgi:hypothetical protein